jgi:hypothetical protein
MAINWLDAFKMGGTGALGYAQSQATSRAAGGELARDREILRQSGEQQYVDALDAREKARQASAENAYQRLLQYDYVNQGGTKTPMLSPYSRAIQGPGANAKRLASDQGIIEELQQRASFGDPYFPGSPGLSDQIFSRQRMPGSDNPGDVYGDLARYMQAGAGEKTAGWLGAILPFLGKVPWGKLVPGGGNNPVKQDPNIFQEPPPPNPPRAAGLDPGFNPAVEYPWQTPIPAPPQDVPPEAVVTTDEEFDYYYDENGQKIKIPKPAL